MVGRLFFPSKNGAFSWDEFVDLPGMAAQADADPDASDGADRSVLATAALANQWEAVPWVAVVANPSYQTGVSSPNKNVDAFLLGNYGTPVGMEKGQCFFTFRFKGPSIVWIGN